MISWLKKYGLTILKDIGIVAGFLPAVASAAGESSNPTVTKVSDTLTGVANIIQTIEGAFAAAYGAAQTGAAKMSAVLPFVSQLVQQWLADNFPGSAEIGDQTLFQKGVGEIAQGVVDVLNSLKSTPETSTPVKSSGPAPASVAPAAPPPVAAAPAPVAPAPAPVAPAPVGTATVMAPIAQAKEPQPGDVEFRPIPIVE